MKSRDTMTGTGAALLTAGGMAGTFAGRVADETAMPAAGAAIGAAVERLDGRAKVEIALARGKKSWDKRQSIAERTAKREVEVEVGRRLKGMRD